MMDAPRLDGTASAPLLSGVADREGTAPNGTRALGRPRIPLHGGLVQEHPEWRVVHLCAAHPPALPPPCLLRLRPGWEEVPLGRQAPPRPPSPLYRQVLLTPRRLRATAEPHQLVP